MSLVTFPFDLPFPFLSASSFSSAVSSVLQHPSSPLLSHLLPFVYYSYRSFLFFLSLLYPFSFHIFLSFIRLFLPSASFISCLITSCILSLLQSTSFLFFFSVFYLFSLYLFLFFICPFLPSASFNSFITSQVLSLYIVNIPFILPSIISSLFSPLLPFLHLSLPYFSIFHLLLHHTSDPSLCSLSLTILSLFSLLLPFLHLSLPYFSIFQLLYNIPRPSFPIVSVPFVLSFRHSILLSPLSISLPFSHLTRFPSHSPSSHRPSSSSYL